MEDHSADIINLKLYVAELQRKYKYMSDWHDTMRSPLYKKLWWWLQGYNMFSLGTWYVAPWNRRSSEEYNKEF